MIRKLILLPILVFVVIWFTSAYFIKSKTLSLIKQLESDNISVSYNDVEIFGFPYFWQIKFVQLTIKFVDHIGVYEVNLPKLQLFFVSNFEKVKILFENEIYYAQNSKDQKKEYKILFGDGVKAIIKLEKPLYRMAKADKPASILKSFSFNNPALSVIQSSNKIFDIKDLVIFGTNNLLFDGEDLIIQVKAAYEGQKDIMNFTSAIIDFEGIFKYVINDENKSDYDKSFTVNKFSLVFEDSAIDLHGNLNLIKDKLPYGQFFVNLNQYEKVIDKIIPNNFIIPSSLCKKLIFKAANDRGIEETDISKNVQLNVVFSDKGVNIGSINLFDIKTQIAE